MKRIFFILLIINYLIALNTYAQRENQTVYDSLKVIADTVTDPDTKMDIYRQMALNTNNSDNMMDAALHLYNLARKYENLRYQGAAVSMMSWVYMAQQKHGQAIDKAYEGLECYTKLDTAYFMTRSYVQLGATYSNIGMLREALSHLWKGNQLAEETQDSSQIATIALYVGYIYNDLGLPHIALEYFDKYSQISRLANDDYHHSDLLVGKTEAYKTLYEQTGDTAFLYKGKQMLDATTGLNPQGNNIIAFLNYSVLGARIYVALSKYRNKAQCLQKAHEMLDKATETALQYNIDLFDTKIKIEEGWLLLEENRLHDYRKMAEQINKIAPSEMPDFLELQIEYYRKTAKWDKMLESQKELRTLLNRAFKLDFASDNESYPAKSSYQATCHKIEMQKIENDIRFSTRHKIYMVANILMAIIIAIVITQISYTALHNRKMRILNQRLDNQNNMLKQQTDNLNKTQDEIQDQVTEIYEQTMLLEDQRLRLKRLNKSLMESIVSAESIQKAVVPSETRIRKIFGDVMIMWRPLDIVSGDFYWAAQRGKRKYLMVADCTGHGIPGALLSILGISVLNQIVPQFGSLNAAGILDLFRKKFLEALSMNNGNIDDGMDVALIIMEGNTINYSGANRPLVHIHDHKLSELKPARLCIGNNPMKEHLEYTNHEFSVEPGDTLYAYSDGITDQFGGHDGHDKFSNRALKNLLLDIQNLQMDAQKAMIENSIDNWRNVSFYDRDHVPQLDDQLIIGIRIR